MDISIFHNITILKYLKDAYPLMLESEGYRVLSNQLESENTLDGHLLYLWEKGLISTEMSFDQHDQQWSVSAHVTRITARGLDYLSEGENFNPLAL